MAPDPDINTVVVLSTYVVLVITTDAKEDCMPYMVACRFLLTTGFNSAIFCTFIALASRTGTQP